MPAVISHSRRNRKKVVSEINMVPFIDVMLVLLIIFMVTAPMLTPSVIDVPTVGSSNRRPDQVMHVMIAKDGKLQFKTPKNGNARTVLIDELVQMALQFQSAQGAGQQAAGQDTLSRSAVVIEADRNVRYETVVQVMDKLQRAGVQRVGLAVQQTN